MKKTQEILGLPIVSISDGVEVGKVKGVIISADKGAIDYIVVDNGIQILSARVIPTDNILGIGEYALTIENDCAINDISKIPAAIDLLQKNIQVKGTKVLTKKGRLIGEIGDIYIDENDACKISGLEYIADITQKRVRLIPRESVITFGKNLIVVKDDVENFLLDKVSQLISDDKSSDVEKKNLASSDVFQEAVAIACDKPEDTSKAPMYDAGDVCEGEYAQAKECIEPVGPLGEETPVYGGIFPGSSNTDAPSAQDAQADSKESNAANLFEQRQRQYLIDRRVTKTIADNYGNVIAREGMVINDEIIDIAKSKGKLIELIMNNRG